MSQIFDPAATLRHRQSLIEALYETGFTRKTDTEELLCAVRAFDSPLRSPRLYSHSWLCTVI
jgi:hypothetical protein